jgi:hypothetical protein
MTAVILNQTPGRYSKSFLKKATSMIRSALSLVFATCAVVVLLPSANADSPATGGVKVELIEPGASPRREIRFKPAKGAKQTAVMTITMNQAMTMNGNKLPSQNIPPQKITMEVSVNDVAANGDISFDFKYTDFEVVDDPAKPSPIAATLRTTLKPMIGTTGSGIVSDRGLTPKGELNIPKDLAPSLKQMLDGMKDAMNRLSCPVPAEPIGLGGKWRVIQDVNANGMQITQTSVHEITELDSSGFAMSISVTQDAEPQEIKNPALPAGAVLKLETLDTTGTGTSSLSTTSIFPVKSDLQIETKVDMAVTVAGQNQKLTTELTMQMTLEAGK